MHGPRVLVVEDEAISARAAQVMLRRIGCAVTAVVATGPGALAAAAAEPPDLVLMDIRLKGGMDGIEVARLLRERHGTPAIFVSAYAADELLAAGMPIDALHLTKPIDEDELDAAVRLQGRRSSG